MCHDPCVHRRRWRCHYPIRAVHVPGRMVRARDADGRVRDVTRTVRIERRARAVIPWRSMMAKLEGALAVGPGPIVSDWRDVHVPGVATHVPNGRTSMSWSRSRVRVTTHVRWHWLALGFRVCSTAFWIRFSSSWRRGRAILSMTIFKRNMTSSPLGLGSGADAGDVSF